MIDITPVIFESGKLHILDQTLLPGEERFIEIETKEELYDAIKKLKVRGAPAIGVAAALGLYVCVRGRAGSIGEFENLLEETGNYIASARPTAVNLSWAVERMTETFRNSRPETVEEAELLLMTEANKIWQEDLNACRMMGEYGLELLKDGMGILTHCNAGTIATSKYGTCLAPIHLGKERGMDFKVFADETRPLLQGARLTAWELDKAGVDVTLICDNMASIVMQNGWIDAVVVGCDRMAANGDGANKIGTSGVAILAHEYGIPFYMFVPTSTIDLDTKTGEDITIELRSGDEIGKLWYENPVAPEGIKTYNPSFDVTKAKYITAVITEKGIVRPPYEVNLAKILEK